MRDILRLTYKVDRCPIIFFPWPPTIGPLTISLIRAISVGFVFVKRTCYNNNLNRPRAHTRPDRVCAASGSLSSPRPGGRGRTCARAHSRYVIAYRTSVTTRYDM
ncbi:hypothetical protein EVAR_103161_1 [Eumeta japonica]|uniref:Uncharacterized protein n=1 Tax=Eumeta variegata TaxID=151549 RepID=A0A4C1YHW2_EUMVA|nr:hypothetical protein EVAR_103161_1 [Eumeta japonica]